MLHNIFIIMKREYLERVRTRAFVIMTFLIPLLMSGVSIVPTMLANRASDETKHLVVVAADRDTAEMIRSRIEQGQDKNKTKDKGPAQKRGLTPSRFSIEVGTDTSDSQRKTLTEKVKLKQLDGFVWATPEAIAAKKIDFVTRDVASFVEGSVLEESVSDALRQQALKNKGLGAQEIENVLEGVKVEAVSSLGAGAPNPRGMIVTTFVMVMVLYMTVLLYGINVMRAILEEKTSRIMEVMLSTASAKEMMAGKILGVGAVGLTQVAIWCGTVGLISAGTLAGSPDIVKGVFSVKLILSFAGFFLLGYVLYSTLCAAVGAMVNSEQEAQQLQFLVMMPMILSIIVIINIFQHPSSTLAFWGSIFPFTAPLVMFTRIAVETPPGWQIALSIGVMLATIYVMVLLCSRIYRIGILMYGKKPTLPEIMKWIRYA